MNNSMQKKLREGKNVVGPFIKIASPEVIEIMGRAGFDYVILDCEHGPLDPLQSQDMVRAAEVVGISTVIRVGTNDPVMISRALDIGADAVQIPQIGSKEDAENAVKAAKFAPQGQRGVCAGVRAAQYSHLNKHDYFKKANEETMIIIHIEGEQAVNNIDEILSVDGIDVVFLGPYDLSQSLGISGQVDNPKLLEMMESITKKAKDKGKIVGVYVDNEETAKKWMDLGVQYISFKADTSIIYEACKGRVEKLKS